MDGSNRRGIRLLKWIERLFLVAGVAALGWCAFVLSDAYRAQRLGREALESIHERDGSSSNDPSKLNSRSHAELPLGTPLAELSIPRLGLAAVVLHGSDARTLRQGVGHIENTPLPGENGNVAIAGHRDSFFRPLKDIRIGDDIVLSTPEEDVHYQVSSFRVVNSFDVGVIGRTKDAVLTLVTCYPFWFIGQAPDRFVVRASRVDNPIAADSRIAADTRSAALRVRKPDEVSLSGGKLSTRSDDSSMRRNRETARLNARENNAGVVSRMSRSDASESSADDARRAGDEEFLVRKAVERFRVMYNAGAARHRSPDPDALMTFRSCEVAIAGTAAEAVCSAGGTSLALASPLWTISLRHADGEWSVTSIATR